MIVHANRLLPGSGLQVYEVENAPLPGSARSPVYGSTWWFSFGPGYAHAFYAEGDEIVQHTAFEVSDGSMEHVTGTWDPETGARHRGDMTFFEIAAFLRRDVARKRREALAA